MSRNHLPLVADALSRRPLQPSTFLLVVYMRGVRVEEEDVHY